MVLTRPVEKREGPARVRVNGTTHVDHALSITNSKVMRTGFGSVSDHAGKLPVLGV